MQCSSYSFCFSLAVVIHQHGVVGIFFFVYVPNQISESVFYSCWLLESICDIGKHAIFHWTMCTIDIFDLKFSGNLGHQSFAFRLASIISHSFASALSLSLYLLFTAHWFSVSLSRFKRSLSFSSLYSISPKAFFVRADPSRIQSIITISIISIVLADFVCAVWLLFSLVICSCNNFFFWQTHKYLFGKLVCIDSWRCFVLCLLAILQSDFVSNKLSFKSIWKKKKCIQNRNWTL